MARLSSLKKAIGPKAWEDIAQQAWVVSMNKAFGKEYFDKYLYKAMVNIALNSLRRNNKEQDLIDNLTKLSPTLNLESLDLICDVHRVFQGAGYNPNQIHACYLFFCANFSLREIVGLYGMNPMTWKRFFDKTRTLFKKELRDYQHLRPRKKEAGHRAN